MKVQLAPEAEADLLESVDVVRERNPLAAERLARRVFSTLKRLARGDFEGPEQRLTTGEVVRAWSIPPFRIYYQRRQDALHVIRIYHHARRPITK